MQEKLRELLETVRYDTKALGIAREKRRIISDKDSQYVYGYGWHDAIDAVEAALAASEPAPQPDMIGGTCSKCGHVHVSIVCTCGCDISGQLFQAAALDKKQ